MATACDRKICPSCKPFQWQGDTQRVTSSALQKVFAGFQQRNLYTAVIVEGWIEKKNQLEKQQRLKELIGNSDNDNMSWVSAVFLRKQQTKQSPSRALI